MACKLFCLSVLLVLSAGATYNVVVAQNETNVSTVPAAPPNTTESNSTVPVGNTTDTVPTTGSPVTTVATTKGPNITEPTTTSEVVATTQSTTSNVTIHYQTGTTELYNGTTHEATTASKPCTKNSFDAASFVGGIVLGLGLCGIVFFFYKWYLSKQRTAAPYQQF